MTLLELKHTRATALGLPENIRALRLPDLEAFTSHQTIGPTGQTMADINGRAAAIRCYDAPVTKGAIEPVDGSSSHLGEYQGELLDKVAHTKRFLSLTTRSRNYNFDKMDTVLRALEMECTTIAETIRLGDLGSAAR